MVEMTIEVIEIEMDDAPDSLWPNNKSRTIRFFRRAWRSALMLASIAWLMRFASASRANRVWRWSCDSSGGGLRTSSSGSIESLRESGTGIDGVMLVVVVFVVLVVVVDVVVVVGGGVGGRELGNGGGW